MFSIWKRLKYRIKKQALNYLARRYPGYVRIPDTLVSNDVDGKMETRYQRWLKSNAPENSLSGINVAELAVKPFFSIVIPTYNSRPELFTALIESIEAQTYTLFEVCISDDGSKDGEFKNRLKELARRKDDKYKVTFSKTNQGIASNTNRAIASVKGDFIVFVDHDDLIEPYALAFLAEYINNKHDTDIVYSDHDLSDVQGNRYNPRLQPGYCPDMLTSHMYCPHLLAVRTRLVKTIGAFDPAMDGAQDFDFLLRAVERARHVGHIPMILYTWRSVDGSAAFDAAEKPYAFEAGRRALENAMKRRDEDAIVLKARETGMGVFRVKRRVRDDSFSHIIEAHTSNVKSVLNGLRLLAQCPPEIIIVVDENNQALLEDLEKETGPDVKLMTAPKGGNRSVFYNIGANAAASRHLIFSSYDVEIIDSEYPLAVLEHTQRDEIGAVGVKLIYPNGTFYHTGMILGVNGVGAYAHRCMYQGPGHWSFAQCIRNYSAVSWDLMGVRKDKWELVGGFDEELTGFQDVDFCLKLMKKEFLNLYTPYMIGVKIRRPHTLEELRNKDAEKILFKRHGDLIRNDPFYHPLLTRTIENFSIDFEGNHHF